MAAMPFMYPKGFDRFAPMFPSFPFGNAEIDSDRVDACREMIATLVRNKGCERSLKWDVLRHDGCDPIEHQIPIAR